MESLDNYLPICLIDIIQEYTIDCTKKDKLIEQLNQRFSRFSKILDWRVIHHNDLENDTTIHKYSNGETFIIPNNKLSFVRQVKLEKITLYWLDQGVMNPM